MSSNETSNGPAKIRSHGHDSYYFCTSWVSAFVAVPKAHGEVRVCIDICAGPMKLSFVNATNPNTGRDIARPQWGNSLLQARPTLGLPLNWAPPGLLWADNFFHFPRLKVVEAINLRLTPASEIYQFVIQQVVNEIPEARNISDDNIVFGKNSAEHSRSLDQTMQPLHANGLTLNKGSAFLVFVSWFSLAFKSLQPVCPLMKRK